MNKKSISKDSLVVQQVQVQYVVPGIDKKTAIFDILATDSEGRNRMKKMNAHYRLLRNRRGDLNEDIT